jgi:hypothetical protein
MIKPANKAETRSSGKLRASDPAGGGMKPGGVKPADPKVARSAGSPKPHGDKLQHAVDEAAEKRARRF